MASSPAYAKHPQHTLSLSKFDGTVTVSLGGQIIASSDCALQMHEGNYPPVMYIPIVDCILENFTKTSHSTHCPFKGDASYWSLEAGSAVTENAAWGYETPFDEMVEITDHVAFYPDKVDIEIS